MTDPGAEARRLLAEVQALIAPAKLKEKPNALTEALIPPNFTEVETEFESTAVRWGLLLPDGRLLRVPDAPSNETLLRYAALLNATIQMLTYHTQFTLKEQKEADTSKGRFARKDW